MLKSAQIFFTFLVICLALSKPIFADISTWQKGFTLRLIDQSTAEVDTSLNELKNIGTNFLTITPGWITDSATSVNVDRKSRTPSDQLLIYTINKAHSLGMKVMLKPHLDIKGGNWRANLDPYNKHIFHNFFVSYY